MESDSVASYVSWEEEEVWNEKDRRREVHYYLKRSDGRADLVVVGREKSGRHMPYYYAIKGNKFLTSYLKRSSILKLRSTSEVIDWLNSVISVSGERTSVSFRRAGDDMEGKLNLDNAKNVSLFRPGFMWIGSPLACQKKRRHYQSFCRNGIVISIQDFVYVLAEEDKRLVAYLDDMYEDSRGNKMVVVRWFHRIDEVGFVLPRNYNDREIFFSLCLQDLSVECIDGKATVLSPEHFEKFKNEAAQMCVTPFMCCRQFDNDDVLPYDITHIRGYWKQDLLRKVHSSSYPLKPIDVERKVKLSRDDAGRLRPNKRIRRCDESEIILKPANKGNLVENRQICHDISTDSKCSKIMSCQKERCSPATFSERDDAMVPSSRQHLSIGSQIEVISQDSGMRGCWFRATIIKRHKYKVKVRYVDIKNAVDDEKNLEEWILTSRLTAADVLGIRVSGRTIVRPSPLPNIVRGLSVIKLGSVVDAWWHDGWWEGIVVKKGSKDKLNVYFPGEKQEHIFSPDDLRQSQEWIDNGWNTIKDRPELVSELCGSIEGLTNNKLIHMNKESGCFSARDLTAPLDNDDLPTKISYSKADNDVKKPNCPEVLRDLSKDDLLAQLRWKSSGKRRHSRSPVHKWHCGANSGSFTFENIFVKPSLNYDPDNCKYAPDSHFSSSVMSSLTSLVM